MNGEAPTKKAPRSVGTNVVVAFKVITVHVNDGRP